MAELSEFNNSNWITKINFSKNIDYFFTQRKVTQTSEYIDTETLERKEKKETITQNFLAIYFPNISDEYNKIDIEIWGDTGYNYEGTLSNRKGTIPNLLLSLFEDSEIFVKLTYHNETDKDIKTYINFINILKRYQKTND